MPDTTIRANDLLRLAGILFDSGMREEGRILYSAAHYTAIMLCEAPFFPKVKLSGIYAPGESFPPESEHRFQPLTLLPNVRSEDWFHAEIPLQWQVGFLELEQRKWNLAGYDEFTEGHLLCCLMNSHRDEFHQWIFTRDWQLFAENPFWLPYFKNNLAGFRFLSPNHKHYLVDLHNAVPQPALKGRYLYIGSSQYWGHWILDFLPLVLYYREIFSSQEVKLVFGPLSSAQRKTLFCLGVPDEEIYEIRIPPGTSAVYSFETLIRPRELPGLVGNRFLRSHFLAAAVKAVGNLSAPPARVGLFLSRGILADTRIANEAEISRICQEHGVETIHIENLPFEEQLVQLSEARILVLPFGSGLGNTVFCREDTIIILLLSEAFQDTPENTPYDDTFKRHLFGVGLKIIPVWGNPLAKEAADRAFKSPITLQILCHYKPQDLQRAFSEALALLEYS